MFGRSLVYCAYIHILSCAVQGVYARFMLGLGKLEGLRLGSKSSCCVFVFVFVVGLKGGGV